MRWLGLRVRIAIAIIAVAIGACWSLAVSTSEWAQNENDQQRATKVSASVEMDLDQVSAVLQRNPDAKTEDFVFAGIPAAGYLGAEGVLIPLTPGATTVDPARAHTYFQVSDVDLVRNSPRCLQPGVTSWMTDLEPHQLGLWTEACGDFLMGYGMLTVGTGDAARTWLLVQALPNDPTTDPLWELREVLTANSVFIVIGAVLVAAVLAAMVAHPVARARTMAEAVAAGDLDVRIPVRGRDEVARMSTAVNTMADRLTTQIAELEHANETQRRFVSDVAHELRTPTAALLASAEALGSPATLDAAARQIAPQLHRLVGLTEDLLELGRMDAGQAVVASGRIDLVDLVREVVAETDVGGAVALSSPESLEVSTDPARARVVVRNLVANALQHGTPPVAVEVGQSATSLTVTVHDEGAGVPTDLRDRVFDRFVRGDESRHGASSGLGLSIARENAHLLGGELELRPDGRTFVLTLPGAADQR